MPDRSRPGVDIAGESTNGISAAVDLCAEAEAIVLCLGESAAMSGEAASRVDLGLPGRQRALAEAVLDLGKPVVVMLSSGRPLACHGCSSAPTRSWRHGFFGTKQGMRSPTF